MKPISRPKASGHTITEQPTSLEKSLISRSLSTRMKQWLLNFTRAIGNNGFSDRVVIDKSGANLAGLQNMNCVLILNGWFWLIEVLQAKYLNNIIE